MPRKSCRLAVAATRLLGGGSLQSPAHAWHRYAPFCKHPQIRLSGRQPSSIEGNAKHSVIHSTMPHPTTEHWRYSSRGAATARDLPRDKVIRAKRLAAANVVLNHRLQTNAPRASRCVVGSLIMTHTRTQQQTKVSSSARRRALYALIRENKIRPCNQRATGSTCREASYRTTSARPFWSDSNRALNCASLSRRATCHNHWH